MGKFFHHIEPTPFLQSNSNFTKALFHKIQSYRSNSSCSSNKPRKSLSMSTSNLLNKASRNKNKQKFRNAHSTASYMTTSSSKNGNRYERKRGRRIISNLSNFSHLFADSITMTSIGEAFLHQKYSSRERYKCKWEPVKRSDSFG